MGIRNWFRRKKKLKIEPIGEHAQRFDAKPSPAEPKDILLAVFTYIVDMLSDRRLIPTYLRSDMAAARRLPIEAWELAQKPKKDCPLEFMEIRSVAVEYGMRVSKAILKAQLDERKL